MKCGKVGRREELVAEITVAVVANVECSSNDNNSATNSKKAYICERSSSLRSLRLGVLTVIYRRYGFACRSNCSEGEEAVTNHYTFYKTGPSN